MNSRNAFRSHSYESQRVELGFEVIYGLPFAEIWKRTGSTRMLEEIHQVFNKRASFNHHERYKESPKKEQLAPLKAICDTIIALWKGSIGQAITDEIKAKLAELEKMETVWETDSFAHFLLYTTYSVIDGFFLFSLLHVAWFFP